MKQLIVVFLMLSFFTTEAQVNMDHFYPVDAGHSYLEFSIRYMGYAKVKGRFESFSGMIRYNEEDLENTSVSLNVEIASIDSDGEWRDGDLKSANWFDAERFPLMKFESGSVKKTDQGFDITGLLTIKDVTQEVIFQMDPPSGVLKDTRGDLQVIFTGTTTIDRTSFGVAGERWSRIKEGITSVANEVDIEISILGKRYQEGNLSGFVRNTERPPGKIRAAYDNGGIPSALEAFAELVEDPEIELNANALNIVGHYLVVKGELDQARALFEKNMTAFPENATVYRSMGEILVRQGDLGQARDMYGKALELDGKNATAGEILRHL